MRFVIFLICLVFLVLDLKSQEGYVDGYYITNTDDTIFAKIAECKSYTKVKVILSDGKKKKLSSKKIKSFNRLKTQKYKSIRYGFGPRSQQFVRVLEESAEDISLYELYQDVNSVSSEYNSSTGGYLIDKPSDDLKVLAITGFLFKKNIEYFIGDYPILMNKVENGVYGYDELPLIVKMYNDRNRDSLISKNAKKINDSLPQILNSKYFRKGIVDSINSLNVSKRHPHRFFYYIGYYVTLNKDTILSYIKNKTLFSPYNTRIRVIEGELKPKTVKANEILEYFMFPDELHRPIKKGIWAKGNKFAKVIVDGEIKLFDCPKKVSSSFTNSNNVSSSYSKSVSVYYIQKGENTPNNKPIEIDKGNFRRILLQLVWDNNKLVQQLQEKQFKFEDVSLVIQEYNQGKRKK